MATDSTPRDALWSDATLAIRGSLAADVPAMELEQPFARVGWHPASDHVVGGAGVAKRHLYLHAALGGVYAVDLATAGVDHQPPGHWLTEDEELAVASHRLGVRLVGPPAETRERLDLLAPTEFTPPFPMLKIYRHGEHTGHRRCWAPLTVIGRKKTCSLQLKGRRVSDYHCIFYWEAGRLWCVDLNSSHGTGLNGSRITAAEVRIGDRVEIGEFSVEFERLSHRPHQSQPEVHPPAQETHPPVPAPMPSAVSTAAQSATQPTADFTSLAEEMARFKAIMADERQRLQAEWKSLADALAQERAAIESEVARLAEERRDLEQLRQHAAKHPPHVAESQPSSSSKPDHVPGHEPLTVEGVFFAPGFDGDDDEQSIGPGDTVQGTASPAHQDDSGTPIILPGPIAGAPAELMIPVAELPPAFSATALLDDQPLADQLPAVVTAPSEVAEPAPSGSASRSKRQSGDLATTVLDRMAKIDRDRQVRQLLLWSAAMLVIGVGGATAACVYYWNSPTGISSLVHALFPQ